MSPSVAVEFCKTSIESVLNCTKCGYYRAVERFIGKT